jgi:hypothetical protein
MLCQQILNVSYGFQHTYGGSKWDHHPQFWHNFLVRFWQGFFLYIWITKCQWITLKCLVVTATYCEGKFYTLHKTQNLKYINIFLNKFYKQRSWKRLKLVDRKLYKECKCKEKKTCRFSTYDTYGGSKWDHHPQFWHNFLIRFWQVFFSLHLHSLYNFLSTSFKRFQDLCL